MATKRKSSVRSKQRSKSTQQSPGGTELLLLELQEIHSAENQLARVAPRFVKAAESEQLQQFLDRRMETGAQLIEDLDNAFAELEQSPGRKKNVAAQGLLDDLREHVQEIAAGPARDAMLIAGIQKLEHYCIAAWGTSRALAQAMGIESVANSMARVLDEGKDLDQKLTQLAEQEILPELLADEDADEALEDEESDGDEDEDEDEENDDDDDEDSDEDSDDEGEDEDEEEEEEEEDAKEQTSKRSGGASKAPRRTPR